MGLLRITPERTLEFPSTLYASYTIEIKLENATDGFVAFKIKTTAPKGYLVKPSTGIIRCGETQGVQIILQPIVEGQALCNDRFLIQATRVKSDEPLPRDYWNELDRSLIEEHRLSVAFRGSGSQDHYHQGIPSGGNDRINSGTTQNHHQHHQSGIKTCSGAAGNSDIQKQYNELVTYTLALEKQKDEYQKQVDALKKQIVKLSSTSSPPAQKSTFSHIFEVWHLPVYLLLALVVWYFFFRANELPSATQF